MCIVFGEYVYNASDSSEYMRCVSIEQEGFSC